MGSQQGSSDVGELRTTLLFVNPVVGLGVKIHSVKNQIKIRTNHLVFHPANVF